MKRVSIYLPLIVVGALVVSRAQASDVTVGPDGINSAGLLLTGAGIAIGQVEGNRPGDVDPGEGETVGDDTAHRNDAVNPTKVFRRTGLVRNDNGHDSHAQQVASILISTDPLDKGVAPGGELYAIASDPVIGFEDRNNAVSAQAIVDHVIAHDNGNPNYRLRAINMSFNTPLTKAQPDGNQLLTQFIDWSAHRHDILYVVAGKQLDNNGNSDNNYIPTDNFNGMTVATSRQIGVTGEYVKVAERNEFKDPNESDDLRSVSIVAPGEAVRVGTFSNGHIFTDGTSNAAPHVTGTVALLQQYANQQLAGGASPRWDEERARRHEVMKAVLMNSADKIQEGSIGSFNGRTIPAGGLLGMEKTIVDQNDQNWLQSEAFDKAHGGSGIFTALDNQMGAGQLNASRAFTQFKSGEWDSDGANVPVIGWDYGRTTGENDIARYVFDQQLPEGSFISITLAFDRVVAFDSDTEDQNHYDADDTFLPSQDSSHDEEISDLDIYLLPKGAFSFSEAVAESLSPDSTVDHIFFQIPETGEYEFWVHQWDEDQGSQDYAVAWWALGTGPSLGADLDDDGDVDSVDIDRLWAVVRGDEFDDPGSDDEEDLNGDGFVNEDDVDYLLASLLDAGTGRQYGDADLDGGVGGLDFTAWRLRAGTGWAHGDFDGDGGIGGLDFTLWRTRPTVYPGEVGAHAGGVAAVPEPSGWILALVGCALMARFSRGRI